jgi:hypothetical protein
MDCRDPRHGTQATAAAAAWLALLAAAAVASATLIWAVVDIGMLAVGLVAAVAAAVRQYRVGRRRSPHHALTLERVTQAGATAGTEQAAADIRQQLHRTPRAIQSIASGAFARQLGRDCRQMKLDAAPLEAAFVEAFCTAYESTRSQQA